MIQVVKRKIISCNLCLGIGINQLLLEYKDYFTEVIERKTNSVYVEKIKNHRVKSVAKSSKNKKNKI